MESMESDDNITPLFLATADLHLSDRPPICRAGIEDWIGYQRGLLAEINSIAQEHNIPVLCAGDIFDRPRVSPRLEMMAMEMIGEWIFIPGQHDMPGHDYNRAFTEGSFGVLSSANTLAPYTPVGIRVMGNRYGDPIPVDCLYEFGGKMHQQPKVNPSQIALIHHLVWYRESPFPGAPEEGNVCKLAEQFVDYDFVVSGDNHQSFTYWDPRDPDKPLWVNPGPPWRRTTDAGRPEVVLVYEDRKINSIEMPDYGLFSDAHLPVDDTETDERIREFVESLRESEFEGLDFTENVRRYLTSQECSERAKHKLLEAIEQA
jgi:hypothetical protein